MFFKDWSSESCSALSPPICKALQLWFLLCRVAVLPLCVSLAEGSHPSSGTHVGPAKGTIPKASHQAFSPCGFLTILLTQAMSSFVLLNSRSAWREAQPMSMTPAWNRICSSSPRHCCGAGCCSLSPLQGCLQLHVLECCQAGTLICFSLATNNHRLVFSCKLWCPCLCNHTREMEGGEKMGGRPISAFDISIPFCIFCCEKTKKTQNRQTNKQKTPKQTNKKHQTKQTKNTKKKERKKRRHN